MGVVFFVGRDLAAHFFGDGAGDRKADAEAAPGDSRLIAAVESVEKAIESVRDAVDDVVVALEYVGQRFQKSRIVFRYQKSRGAALLFIQLYQAFLKST